MGDYRGIWMYNIGPYTLDLNYDQRGNFNKIQLTASNMYTSTTLDLDVHFDGDVSDGVKWYQILLIILAVLAVVGVIYGMFLKYKAHKKQNNTSSLMTEEEELDEQV